jgi:hypothetical protein
MNLEYIHGYCEREAARLVDQAETLTVIEGFTKNTFTAMVEGVRQQALSQGMIEERAWDAGIAELYRTAEADGTFCYTFFKALGIRMSCVPIG